MKLLSFFIITFFAITNLFGQSFQSIPGKTEAENYTSISGVSTEACSDEGGGLDIGWMPSNSWAEYKISAPSSGYYSFKFRIANGFSDDAKLQLLTSAGSVITETILPRTGGMQSWETVAAYGFLNAGEQSIRLFAQTGVFAVNWFETNLPKNIPARIEAEAFDKSFGIRTETTTDVDGQKNVSYIDDGDWMDYNVNVPVDGLYHFDFRVSNAWGNGLIKLRNQSGSELAQIAVPVTGGWNNYNTLTISATLSAGSQILRVYAERGAFNFNWFEVRGSAVIKPKGVITFAGLAPKTLDSGPFILNATSTNNETPIRFSISNPNIISLSDSAGVWKATPLAAGTAVITASQEGSDSFSKSDDVSLTQIIKSTSGEPAGPNKIVLDGSRWYQLNNTIGGLAALSDGITSENVQTGWGKVLNTYDAYYPLKDGEEISIEAIKFYDLEGSETVNPMTLSVITDQWERIEIASFKGYEYGAWVGPYPDRSLTGDAKFQLDTPISNVRYLVLKIQGVLPTEMELYGTHIDPNTGNTPIPVKNVRLDGLFGVNGYEWNFEDGNAPSVINESKMTAAKNFSGFRHYMDWERLEAQEGSFSFNPTISGGWNYDAIYERCKAENIEVLACLKTIPNWIQETYPASERDMENVPLRYGKDFADPASYIEQARVGFQYAARYGSNTNVDPSLLHLNTTPRWNGDVVNAVKIGLNLVKYIECDNERDKWWKGRKAYQTAREYAANLSAFYDGHKNTLGAAVGIKNADPNMKVVIAGLVTGPDYVRAMVDWCKEFRGYNADGSVNICWDIINFHLYPDNGNSAQSGTSTRGAAIEVTNATENLQSFRKVAHELCGDMPVWITEIGYDINQGSPLKAVPVGNKSTLVTQADWLLRTSLFAARNGIEKLFFYQMYDDNDGGGMFGTSGLLNMDQTRRPAADYIYQVNKKFGSYQFQETMNNDPIVDRYETAGKSVYIMSIPDEVGRTGTYTLNLPGVDSVIIYTPAVGANEMLSQKLPTVDGHIAISVSETPIFVEPIYHSSARQSGENNLIEKGFENQSSSQKAMGQAYVYPNPAAEYVIVNIENVSLSKTEVNIFDAHSGRLFRKSTFDAGAISQKRIDINSLPVGTYVVEIKQGNTHSFRKLAKVQ